MFHAPKPVRGSGGVSTAVMSICQDSARGGRQFTQVFSETVNYCQFRAWERRGRKLIMNSRVKLRLGCIQFGNLCNEDEKKKNPERKEPKRIIDYRNESLIHKRKTFSIHQPATS